jgi:HAD superfamily hydrolase (TIGR01509 family)
VGSKKQKKFSLSAAIFDLDGTVLNNEEEYGRAFKKVLQNLGICIGEKYPHISGIGIKESWEFLVEKFKIKTTRSLEDLVKATQEAYAEELPRVKLQKGFIPFIEELKRHGIALALATSNDAQILQKVNGLFDLKRFFAVITTKEEVRHLKPAPDLFLKAAEKLKTMPEKCLVVEDTQAGIEAAHRAGMKAIGIASDSQRAEDLRGAKLIISNFEGLTVEELLIHITP